MTFKNLMNEYKATPVQVRASFWFLVCGVLQNGLSIITLPIFTRLLTTEQYGLSSTYFAWNDLVVVICTLRLSYGVFDKGMIKYEHSRDKFESALLGLTTTLSLSMLVLFLIFHSAVEALTGMSFVLCLSLFLAQICAPAMLFWTARSKYEYNYRKFTVVTIATAVFGTLLNLSAVLLVDYDKGVVKILSYQIIWVLIYLVFYIRIFFRGRIYFDKGIWRYALGFNLPLIPYFLSTLVLDKADRIMIGKFCGQSEVAFYSVSYNLGRLMVLLTSALDATFTPWMYQKIKDRDLSKVRYISTMIMVGFLGVAMLFMLFAPDLIKIFADSDYSAAVYVIPPVVAGYFFVMLYGLVSKVEFYFEKTKGVAGITVVASLLNILLNYIAIPAFGYVAAAYTTLICYIVMGAFHLAYSRYIAGKELQRKNVFPLHTFCLLSFLMIGITVVVNLIYPYTLLRYALIVAGAVALIIFRKKIVEIVRVLKKR